MYFAILLLLVASVAAHEECGKPEVRRTRVLGGTDAERGSWPWQVLLTFQHYRPHCGGTLVGRSWVVTAAHCVRGREEQPYYFTVTAGEHDRSEVEGSEQILRVKRIVVHPAYGSSRLRINDIAMFELARPVRLGTYVKLACLPKDDIAIGTECYVTGWGMSGFPGKMGDTLRQGKLPVVPNEDCQELNFHTKPIKVTKDMVCGGSGESDGTSACYGDDGGPFVCMQDDVWYLHGSVSSFSPTCRSDEMYTVSSRTNYFRTWIYKTMKSSQN